MANAYVRSQVAARILEAIKAGGLGTFVQPWRKVGIPLRSDGNPFTGINRLVLGITIALRGYTSPRFYTLKAIDKAGGRIRETERKAWHPVVFFRSYDRKQTTEEGETITRPALAARISYEWNLDQVEGIDRPAEVPFTPSTSAEVFAAGYLQREGIGLDHGGDSAFYSPSADRITLPARVQFESAAAYYQTLFHEVAHSTGHESRLARESVVDRSRFASHSYSVEECIAELTAAECMVRVGLDPLLQSSAEYVGGWSRTFTADPGILLSAASAAERAAAFISNKEGN